MGKSICKLLAEADDVDLCAGVVGLIHDYYNDEELDVSAIGVHERVPLLIWNASYRVGNGGFRYLFETTYKGDEDLWLTFEAFQAIGRNHASDAVERTFALFPKSRPFRDMDRRLKHYLRQIKGSPTEMEKEFWDARDEMTKCLADYIRSRSAEYLHLDKPPTRTNRAKKRKSAKQPDQAQTEDRPTLDDLPHWARVAFVVRCAQRVFPLLAQNWDGIPEARSRAVRAAIDLAEQSATEGRPVEGLDDAVDKATIVAGAARLARHGLSKDEPCPENAFLGSIVASVANAANRAAETARVEPEVSLTVAWESYQYAISAAKDAECRDIREAIADDFDKLYRVVIRGKWTDQTRVSVEIWSMLD